MLTSERIASGNAYLERVQLGRDDALHDVQLWHPLLRRALLRRKLVHLLLVLEQVAPAEAENEEHRLRDGVEHAVLRDIHRRRPGEPLAHRGGHRIEHVEPRAEEVAEHLHDAPRALAVDELRARDEARCSSPRRRA